MLQAQERNVKNKTQQHVQTRRFENQEPNKDV